jgi:hypothetical protein
MRWAENVARMGEKRNAYRILVGKPEGRPRRRWEDNIKIDIKEIGWDDNGLDSGLIWLRIETRGRLLRTR